MPKLPSVNDFIRAASLTAAHYGFTHAESCAAGRQKPERGTSIRPNASAAERRKDALGGILANGLTLYTRYHLYTAPDPVFCYTVDRTPRSGDIAFVLYSFHVPTSIAEVLLLETARRICAQLGYLDTTIQINSLGDEDSVQRYQRELTHFLRKRLNSLPPETRECMKTHVFDALASLRARDPELASRTPEPLGYLTDLSRKHFREIVEYLDYCHCQYVIDNTLVGHPDVYRGTCFGMTPTPEYEAGREAPLQMRGGRFDAFMRHHTGRDTSAAGAVITLKGRKVPRQLSFPKSHTSPAVYVVQLGFGPKMRTLLFLDELRTAGIPVMQNLACDSLSTQLRDAEARGVKYVVIIGQKEYVEQTAIFRDLDRRHQETLPLPEIMKRLRTLNRKTKA